MLTTDCTLYQLSELGNKGGLMGHVETRGKGKLYMCGMKYDC